MTSPLDAWNECCRIDELVLPGNPDQLEVICCEASERVVSHIGIEYRNCVFNSEAVLLLRKKYAQNGALTVELRANDRAAQIWVRDPTSREWIEVLNQDPTTNDLTFAQVSLVERVRRLESRPDRLITRTEARRLLRELAERAQASKTIRSLPRLLRVLGIDDSGERAEITKQHLSRIGVEADSVKKTTKAKKKSVGGSRETDDARPQGLAPNRRPPTRTEPVPTFKVIEGEADDAR